MHERRSAVATELETLGAAIEFCALPAGDYRAANGVLVERKWVRDLHRTLIEGRLWSQLGRLRSHAARAYLLVEGADLDAGPVSAAAIRGALLAASEQGIGVLRSTSPPDSALWLYRFAARAGRSRAATDRPLYAQRPKAHPPQLAPEAMLASVPTISRVSARALLTQFGTVTAVLRASPAELAAVRGIGPTRAARLTEVTERPHSAYRSRRSREQ